MLKKTYCGEEEDRPLEESPEESVLTPLVVDGRVPAVHHPRGQERGQHTANCRVKGTVTWGFYISDLSSNALEFWQQEVLDKYIFYHYDAKYKISIVF
jgi:hypothetical protein